MELKYIIIENFLGHRYSEIDFSLFNTILIVGRDVSNHKESNGSGKSSIFSAIDYCLFGQYSCKSVDKIVRNGTDQARITLEFLADDGEIYKVQRSRNRKANKSDLMLWHKIGQEFTNINQKTNSETEQELAKILKINYFGFKNSILFSQGDIDGLSSSKSGDKRKTILKEAFNLSLYSKLEKSAKEKISELNRKISEKKAVIFTLGSPYEEIIKYKNILSEIQELLKTENNNHKKIIDDISKKQIELSSAKKIINELDIVELKKQFIENEKYIKQISNNLEIANKNLKDKQNTKISAAEKLKLKNTEYNSYRTHLKQKQEKVLIHKDKNILKEELKELNKKDPEIKALTLSIENEIKILGRPLPDGDVCPECYQILTNEHRKICSNKNAIKVENLTIKLNQNKLNLNELRNSKIKIEEEFDEIVSIEAYIKELKSSNDLLNNDIEHIKAHIEQLDNSIIHIKSEIDNYEISLNKFYQKDKEFKSKIEETNITNLNKNIISITNALSELQNQNEQISKNISLYQIKIGGLSEKITSKEIDNKNLILFNNELKSLEKDFQIYQLVVQSFSSGGIPTLIIYTILDDLQIEANKILTELRPGLELQFNITKENKSGEQEDTLDIIYRLHGSELDGELLSGGQKLMVALSLRLGLSFIIQQRLGINLQFLELDEIDHALDDAGIETLSEIIKKLQYRFKHIMIISHNKDIKDIFSTAILVEYDKINGSTTSVVQSW